MQSSSTPTVAERRLGSQPGHETTIRVEAGVPELRRLFQHDPALPGVMIVEKDGRLAGVVSRERLDAALVKPYLKELSRRRSVRWVLEEVAAAPMRLPAETPLCDAVDAAMSRPVDRVTEPIVVEHADGRFRLVEVPPLLCAQNEQYRCRFDAQTRAAEALRATEEKMRGLFDNAVEGIFQSTVEGKLLSANPAMAVILGFESSDELIRQINDLGRETYADPDDRRAFVEAIEADGAVRDFRTELTARDGRSVWVSINARGIRDEDGRLSLIEGTIDDITEQRRMEQRLRDDARRDALTGLPNRLGLMDALADLVERCRVDPAHGYALMFLDFDQFKLINDTLGHDAGDEFLCEVARRLRAAVDASCRGCGEADPLSMHIARLGGDEFTVLLEGPGAAAEAPPLAECLQARLGAEFRIKDHCLKTTVSIGVVTDELGVATADDLLRDADIAMYAAKAKGKACHVVFDQAMHERAHEQLRLTNDLRHAAERGELRLWYQPILGLAEGQVYGFEALARWEHPQRGMIGPGRFIPLAEDTGLIIPLGWWVLDEACRQRAQWRQRFPDLPIHLCVNVSKLQLFEPGFVDRLGDLFDRYGLAANDVQLELTETTIVEAGERIDHVLQELQQLGVVLLMDDFGTGYSSLSCLHRFPIHLLKLDRQFIQSIEARRDFSAVTQSVITLAHNLDLKVIAEGVENNSQLAQLLALECDLAQGYLFSPPVPAPRAEFMLASDEPLWQYPTTSDPLVY